MKKFPTPIGLIFFFFSPLFSIPLIVRGVLFKDRTSVVLLCCCLAFVSFGFVPSETADKAYYIGLYQLFAGMSAGDFYNDFLTQKPDFIFYVLLFLFSSSGVPFEFFSFVISFISCCLFFFVFVNRIPSNLSTQTIFLIALGMVFAIPLLAFLSGMRNYFSASIVFFGLNCLLIKGSFTRAVIFIVVGVFVHYSSAIFLLSLVCYKFLSPRGLRLLFLSTIVFIFLDKSIIYNLLGYLPLGDVYKVKVDAYLSVNSFGERSLQMGNFNNLLRIYLNKSWFYLALIFVALNVKSSSKEFLLFLSLMIAINVISSSVDLMGRYGMVVEAMFFLLLAFGRGFRYQKSFFYALLTLGALSFMADFMAIRHSLIPSLLKLEYLTLFTIFFIDATTDAGVRF